MSKQIILYDGVIVVLAIVLVAGFAYCARKLWQEHRRNIDPGADQYRDRRRRKDE